MFLPFSPRLGMRSLVIQDQMKITAVGSRPIDHLKELQELLMAMTRIAGSNNRTIRHVQGGEKTRRSVPFVVVRHHLPPTTYRQPTFHVKKSGESGMSKKPPQGAFQEYLPAADPPVEYLS
jgi:hypothetical protein